MTIPQMVMPSQLDDGKYIGRGNRFNGLMKVEVTIEGGAIKSVEIIESKDTKKSLDIALEVIKKILEKQTVEVDTITSATASSKGIKEAVEDALMKGFMQNYESTLTEDATTSTKIRNFIDEHEISPWAKDAIQFAVEEEIITGYTDGKIRPRDNTKRAEA